LVHVLGSICLAIIGRPVILVGHIFSKKRLTLLVCVCEHAKHVKAGSQWGACPQENLKICARILQFSHISVHDFE